MLRLGKPGKHEVLNFVESNVAHYKNGKILYYFPLSVGLARGGDQSFLEIKGQIGTGSPLYGDRPCSHLDVDGLTYAVSSESQITPLPCGFGFTIQNIMFTEIITGPCSKVKNFVARNHRGKEVEYLYYYGMQGNNLYHAVTSRILPAVGPPPLFNMVVITYRTYSADRKRSSKDATLSTPWCGDFFIPHLPDKQLAYNAGARVTLNTSVAQFYHLHSLIIKFLYNTDWAGLVPKATQLSPTHPIFGDLAVKALDSAKFIDANLVAFLSEYQSMSKLFSGISKDVLKGRLADAYLGYNYGLRNQISDYMTILAGVQKTMTVRERQPLVALRASHRVEIPNTTIRKEYHYKIRYRPEASQGQAVLRALREYSLLPNFSTAWDLIPFSFVVDWFYSFQRELDRHQFRTDYLLYDIVAITKSEKLSFTIQDTYVAEQYSELSGITFTRYHRYTSRHVDLPSYFFVDGYVPNFHRHIADGLCLLMKQ